MSGVETPLSSVAAVTTTAPGWTAELTRRTTELLNCPPPDKFIYEAIKCFFANRIIPVDEREFCGTPITPAATPAPPAGAALTQFTSARKCRRHRKYELEYAKFWEIQGGIVQMGTLCCDVWEQRIEVRQI